MSAPPETMMAKLKSAIIATVIWLACAVPVFGGLYACSVWLTPEPFATAAECYRALEYVQYHERHHGEYCAELERGDGAHSRMTLARERIAASCPDRAQHCTVALQRRCCSLQCTADSRVSGSPDEQRLPRRSRVNRCFFAYVLKFLHRLGKRAR